MGEVLILRLDGIGDAVIFSGCLPFIRQKFQTSKVTVVARKYVAELFSRCPFVDDTIAWDHLRFAFNPLYRFAFLCMLSRRKIGVILYPVWTRTTDGDDICSILGAQQVYGFHPPLAQGVREDNVTVVELPTEASSELERYVYFMQALGVEVSIQDIAPRVWTSSFDELTAGEALGRSGVNSFIAVVPGAGSPDRIWALESWAELLLKILDIPNWHVILLGGPDDRKLCDDLCRRVKGGRLLNMAGSFDLLEFAEILKRARLCIGSETGGIHVAAAVGTPTVCIMGGGHFGRFFPHGDPEKNRIVYQRLECYGCNWKCIYDSVRCLEQITPDAVMCTVLESLGEPGSGQNHAATDDSRVSRQA
jgi:ADP-heptose:LPS heptosyltransferase